MNIGWALLINGLIGVPVYIISWILFMAYCNTKFGPDETDNGVDKAIEESDTIGDMMTQKIMPENRETGYRLWLLLAYFMTFFLWEIEIPCKFYALYQAIRKGED